MIHLTLPPSDELARQLHDAHLPLFVREARFLPDRKFRADFLWRADKLIVEVDGGTFSSLGGKRCPVCLQLPRGAHTTGTGRERNCEKQNLAILAGWRYLVVTTQQVRDGRALAWIQQALTKAEVGLVTVKDIKRMDERVQAELERALEGKRHDYS